VSPADDRARAVADDPGESADGPTGGWDDEAAALAYRAFELRHPRYALANRALARHAQAHPGLRVLDLAAGTGGTVAALLPALGPAGRVDAVESSPPMARLGARRLAADPRVRWLASLDQAAHGYDRITCGAAFWQWPDSETLIGELAQRLAPGGALVFNVPAAYLGLPDGPGGGADPWLTQLVQRLVDAHPGPGSARRVSSAPLPTATGLGRALRRAGLVPRRWRHHQRLDQAAWRDWLKIPPVSSGLWSGLDAGERARRIDAAAVGLDLGAWRPERWFGWTAWRPAFEIDALADDTPLVARPDALRRRAAERGVLRLRGVLPKPLVSALRAVVSDAARHAGLTDARGRWRVGRAPAADAAPGWTALQVAAALSGEWQAVLGHASLHGVVRALLDAPARGDAGAVCRIAPPEHLVPGTPPHRDADYLRDGQSVWIAWLPLAACGVPEGVLAVVPGSHRGDGPTRWAAADLRPGDLLLVHARTVHRACPNLRAGACRLSIDLRFAPARSAAPAG